MAFLIVQSSSDTYVDQANSTVNYSTSDVMWVKSGSSANRRALLKFDLSSLTTGDTVSNAALQFYCEATSGTLTGTQRILNVFQVNTTWASTSVTWDTQPTYASTALGTMSPSSGGRPSVNVTQYVRNIVEGSTNNNGFVVQSYTESSTSALGYVFTAAEADALADEDNRPRLVILYFTNDTIPAFGSDDVKQLVGSALDALTQESAEYDWQYIITLDSGDVDLSEDVLGFSHIQRRLPFLLDRPSDRSTLVVTLDNSDGAYSPFKRSSDFYSTNVLGQAMKVYISTRHGRVQVAAGEVVDITEDAEVGTVELVLEQKQLASVLSSRVQNGIDVTSLSGKNPADALYDLIHNWMNEADATINLSSFVSAKSTFTTNGQTVGQATVDGPAIDTAESICSASLSTLYFDMLGRYALHIWQPTEPSDVVLLEDFYNLRLWNDMSLVRNSIRIQYGYSLNQAVSYFDQDSMNDWGLRQLDLDLNVIRGESNASLAARLYAQALADPPLRAKCEGGPALLQYDLGDAVRIVDETLELNDIFIVTGIEIDPNADHVRLEFIKANWPMPRRDFVDALSWATGLGSEVYTGESTNPLADPTPSGITITNSADGSAKVVPSWTYPIRSDAPNAGFVVLTKEGPSSSDASTPTLSDFDQWKEAPSTATYLKLDPIPQTHYFTVAVASFRGPSIAEQLSGQSGNLYSAIVTSSSSPDWTVRQASTGVVVTGNTTGKHYGDLEGGDILSSTGSTILDNSGRQLQNISIATSSGKVIARTSGSVFVLDGDTKFQSSITRNRVYSGTVLVASDPATTQLYVYNSTVGEIGLPSVGSNVEFEAVGQVSIPGNAVVSLFQCRTNSYDGSTGSTSRLRLYGQTSGGAVTEISDIKTNAGGPSVSQVTSTALSYTMGANETAFMVWSVDHPSSFDSAVSLLDIVVTYTVDKIQDLR